MNLKNLYLKILKTVMERGVDAMSLKKIDVKKLSIIVWIIGLLILWEIFSFGLKNVVHDETAALKLPYFHDIMITFFANLPSLVEASIVTFIKATQGFFLGGLVGFSVALIMSFSKITEKTVFPYLVSSQMIPILGLAPIVYSIVKDGDKSRVVIAAFITFFPVAVNTLSGFKSVPNDKKEVLYTYAANKVEVYMKLMIPAALPSFFVGLKLAAPRSITAAILVEMLGTNAGIGVKILYSLYYGGSSSLTFWAAVIMAALLGMTSYFIVKLFERFIIPWEGAMLKKDGV